MNIKVLIVLWVAFATTACATSQYTFEQHKADGSSVTASAKLRPKDFTGGVKVQYGEFTLEAGETTTSNDPLARMVEQMMPMMFCAANPAACTGAQ